MLNTDLIETIILISTFNSTITTSIIQKTKKYLLKSGCIPCYSFLINILFGLLFSISFTNLNFLSALWVGIFSFLGSDTIYKTLEGKLASYDEQRKK